MPPTASTTTEPTVDADGPGDAAHPITPPEPAGPPVPNPTVPAGPVGIAIPDGEPAAAALALLNGLKPDAPAALAGRIDRIAGELADQVEEFRLNTKGTFTDFVAHAARRVKLRRALESRAGRPSVGSAAAEVLGLIRSIKRFRPAEELKAERSKRIASARAELAAAEANVRSFAGVVVTGDGIGHPDREQEKAGFGHQHDAILARLEKLLQARQAVADRLARLDPQGDARRGELVRQAIESNGGVDAVIAALAPSMTAEASAALDRLKADIDGTTDRLSAIDEESRLAADLRAALQALKDQLPGLQWRVGEGRKAAAGGLVQDAVTGDLAAVRRLMAAVAPKLPALAEALEAIRATDDDLVNVVEELIG